MVFDINNFGSAMSTYSVYKLRGIGGVYNGFKDLKNK